MQRSTTVKGRLTIPSEMRKRHGITAGTKIEIIDKDDRIVLLPITRAYVHSLRGKFKGKGLMKALTAERKNE